MQYSLKKVILHTYSESNTADDLFNAFTDATPSASEVVETENIFGKTSVF